MVRSMLQTMNLITGFIGGLSERIVAVLVALAVAQFPLYYVAYANTLSGAQLEAEARYHELEREAALLRLNVEEFIQHHETNADSVFQASGRIHRTTLEHYQRYTAMSAALRAALPWQKPMTLARNFDRQLYDATHFEPGVPLSVEGAIYALAGLLLAWLLAALTRLGLKPRRSRTDFA